MPEWLSKRQFYREMVLKQLLPPAAQFRQLQLAESAKLLLPFIFHRTRMAIKPLDFIGRNNQDFTQDELDKIKPKLLELFEWFMQEGFLVTDPSQSTDDSWKVLSPKGLAMRTPEDVENYVNRGLINESYLLDSIGSESLGELSDLLSGESSKNPIYLWPSQLKSLLTDAGFDCHQYPGDDAAPYQLKQWLTNLFGRHKTQPELFELLILKLSSRDFITIDICKDPAKARKETVRILQSLLKLEGYALKETKDGYRLVNSSPPSKSHRANAIGPSVQLEDPINSSAPKKTELIQPQLNVLILTVSQLEFEAVCRQFDQSPQKETLLGHNSAKLPFSVKVGVFLDYSVIVVCSYQSGNARIKTAMMAAMYQYQPCLVLFVGVGGGVGMEIGSVVISDHIADHTYTHEEKDGRWSFSIKGGSVHADLIPLANRLCHEGAWIKRIKEPPVRPGEVISQIAKVGTIGAGNVKVTSSTGPTAQMLATAGASTHAIDMESAACYDLADTANPKLPFIAIRGISDRLSDKDEETDKYRQPWAAAHASAAAFELLNLYIGD